jgi:hypothetical protein
MPGVLEKNVAACSVNFGEKKITSFYQRSREKKHEMVAQYFGEGNMATYFVQFGRRKHDIEFVKFRNKTTYNGHYATSERRNMTLSSFHLRKEKNIVHNVAIL